MKLLPLSAVEKAESIPLAKAFSIPDSVAATFTTCKEIEKSLSRSWILFFSYSFYLKSTNLDVDVIESEISQGLRNTFVHSIAFTGRDVTNLYNSDFIVGRGLPR